MLSLSLQDNSFYFIISITIKWNIFQWNLKNLKYIPKNIACQNWKYPVKKYGYHKYEYEIWWKNYNPENNRENISYIYIG